MRGVCGGNLEQLAVESGWPKSSNPNNCLEDPILPVASFPVDVEEFTPIPHIGNVVFGSSF